MGKLITLIVAGTVAIGGGAYGLYAYTDLFSDAVDLGNCQSTRAGCCGGQIDNSDVQDDSVALIALAGPAGVMQTAPTAVKLPCCAAKSSEFNCCEDTK